LRELGTTESERELYLTSLAVGPASVQELAKQLGLQRPYVYTLVRSLREKGLAPSASSKYQKKFIVESPSVIIELLRKKKASIDALSGHLTLMMPKLLAQYKQGGAATQVSFYEGKAKFMELYDRILDEEGDETLYFGEAEHFLTLIGEVRLAEWIYRRVRKEVTIRTLMVDSKQARGIPTDAQQLRQTRVLSKEIKTFPASFQVFGRSVIFWQPHTPMAVVLEDEYIAQLMRGTFNLLWEQGTRI
jgi:sugar-specific transcriptional regulator TrmB